MEEKVIDVEKEGKVARKIYLSIGDKKIGIVRFDYNDILKHGSPDPTRIVIEVNPYDWASEYETANIEICKNYVSITLKKVKSK